jgi:hypothetical protein
MTRSKSRGWWGGRARIWRLGVYDGWKDGSTNFSMWTGRTLRCGSIEEGECFEVLALEMGDRERMDLWETVFRSLLERGLNREAVELGIMDGRPGLESLFKRFFSRARTQRCQKHAKAKACRQVRKAERDEFSKDLNKVCGVSS